MKMELWSALIQPLTIALKVVTMTTWKRLYANSVKTIIIWMMPMDVNLKQKNYTANIMTLMENVCYARMVIFYMILSVISDQNFFNLNIV